MEAVCSEEMPTLCEGWGCVRAKEGHAPAGRFAPLGGSTPQDLDRFASGSRRPRTGLEPENRVPSGSGEEILFLREISIRERESQ